MGGLRISGKLTVTNDKGVKTVFDFTQSEFSPYTQYVEWQVRKFTRTFARQLRSIAK